MHITIRALLLAPTALAVSEGAGTAWPGNPRYDYIIVGGGTSGLVVANRLSEDYNVSVAVIEAGGAELYNPNVTDTSKYGNAFGTAIDWQYESVPQAFAGNAPQVLRAGKALGGTSNINGMTYLRAETVQIDAWEQIGNSGWSWESLLPYYKKSEYLQQPTASQLLRGASFDPEAHGSAGPLAVGWTDNMMGEGVVSSINDTFAALDLPFNEEPNSGSMRGLTVFPKTIEQADNVREDAGRAYYWPVSKRPNLDIYLEAFAEKMTWHPDSEHHDTGRTASGVVFVDRNGTRRTLLANREVILSAGSLRSPLLLEQSGIGNPSILQEHGIDVVVDLPFVGENMQDQTTTDTLYTSANSTDFTGLAGYAAYFNADDVFGEAAANLSATILSSLGAYASKTANLSGTLDRAVTEKLFRIQHDLIFKHKIPVSELIISPAPSGPLTLEYWGLLPFSRGSIHINSSDASAPASINPNYFMLDYDVQQQIATARMARRFATTAPFSAALRAETAPGLDAVPANATDGQWEAWLKSTYRSNFHYIATAAMMPRELGGVVDSNLTVYGTGNVRVVDASVVPMQVCGHLTATLYAVAEKAADLVKARWA
ncbi:Glucose oxidase 2 [Stagonosporopsis vannaccii]|nr:Glucose oxidase 2 [Stagonosporopsis vannaccii]